MIHYFIRGSIYKDKSTILFDTYDRKVADKKVKEYIKDGFYNVHINIIEELD